MNWLQLRQSSLDDMLDWAEAQPWCQAMAECVQDAEWHSEGDVWTHTQMVCRQLENLDEWPVLASHERTVLILTALLHDVAKPLTSQVDPETGRVSSPKHAVKGEHLARSILRDLGCDLATREEVARLVRYHGRPAFLLDKEQPAHEVVRLSWLVSNRLLYLFALADTRGRDTHSMTRPEDNLHFWKLQAEELSCYNRRYEFASEHARFVFFHQENPDLHYVPHTDFSCEVTMLAGLPGSGKDTWLSQRQPDLPVVSLDDIRNEMKVDPTDNQGRVVQAARERCREYLRRGTSFAFNATNLQQLTRRRWLDLFADYQARMEITWLEPSFDRLLQQNRNRPDAVPEKVIRKLAAKCEPPTSAEAHHVVLSDGVLANSDESSLR